MWIELSKIPPEGLKIQNNEPVDILTVQENDVEFKNPVNVSLSVSFLSGTLLVKGRVSTKVNIFCSRCLNKYELELVNKDFNFNMYVADIEKVDITDNIREGILIMLPIKPLCKSKCQGLCVKCGQDLNVKDCGCIKKDDDVRWNGLDKLKL